MSDVQIDNFIRDMTHDLRGWVKGMLADHKRAVMERDLLREALEEIGRTDEQAARIAMLIAENAELRLWPGRSVADDPDGVDRDKRTMKANVVMVEQAREELT